MDIRARVDEEGAVAAVDPAAVDEQRLMAIIERHPLDLVLGEVKLGNAVGDPVEQRQAIGVGTIHFPQSEQCPGRNGGSTYSRSPAAYPLSQLVGVVTQTVSSSVKKETLATEFPSVTVKARKFVPSL